MNEKSERQQIEEYLKLHCIEEMLDETINSVIEQRPINPFLEISKIIEATSIPEILNVSITAVLMPGCCCGLEVAVHSNLGESKGFAAYPSPRAGESHTFLKDFTLMEADILKALKAVDPKDIIKVEECICKVVKEDNTVLLALSMACCRAAARFRGVSLYTYISELTETEMCIPMPTPTVIVRTLPETAINRSPQQLLLIPTSSEDLQVALDTLMDASSRIISVAKSSGASASMTQCGSISLNHESIEKCMQVVRGVLADETFRSLRLGVSMQSAVMPPTAPPPTGGHGHVAINATATATSLLYHSEGSPGGAKSGIELSDSVMTLLKDFEIVSVEDPLKATDNIAIPVLREKLKTFMDGLTPDLITDGLAYCVGGVGGQEGCPLQIVACNDCLCPSDIKTLSQHAVFNTVRIGLARAGTVGCAIALCREARNMGWAVVVSIDNDRPASTDTFLADFAVGVGAGQLSAGGLLSGEYVCKYNRLLEISKESPSISFVGRFFRR
eukprot:gene35564-46123_t